jgi:hypothetical protein
MLVEVADDDMFFSVISRTGRAVDSGVIHRVAASEKHFELEDVRDTMSGRPAMNVGGRFYGR